MQACSGLSQGTKRALSVRHRSLQYAFSVFFPAPRDTKRYWIVAFGRKDATSSGGRGGTVRATLACSCRLLLPPAPNCPTFELGFGMEGRQGAVPPASAGGVAQPGIAARRERERNEIEIDKEGCARRWGPCSYAERMVPRPWLQSPHKLRCMRRAARRDGGGGGGTTRRGKREMGERDEDVAATAGEGGGRKMSVRARCERALPSLAPGAHPPSRSHVDHRSTGLRLGDMP